MDHQSPQKLLKSYLDGGLSETERNQLVNWFMGLPKNEFDSFFEGFGEAMEQLSEAEFSELHKKLMDAANQKKQQEKSGHIKVLPLLYKIAASVIVILGLTFLFYEKEQGSFKPLQQKEQKEYVAKKNNDKQKSRIVLPDGTEVWLNASSHLSFPQKFNNNRRDVYLEGEAFFKVAHDKKCPFTVHTPSGLYTRVLGTSFNIKAYKFQKEIQVTVLTGKVAIGKGEKLYAELIKGQQLVFNKVKVIASVNLKPAKNTNAWIKEELQFNGNTLSEIAVMLENSYGVEIEITPGIENLRCKGSFNLSQNPEEIVDILCTLHDLAFTSNSNKIVIRKE